MDTPGTERPLSEDAAYAALRKRGKFETFTLADCQNSRVRLGGACASLDPRGDIGKFRRACARVVE
jgi:hypothetical protein